MLGTACEISESINWDHIHRLSADISSHLSAFLLFVAISGGSSHGWVSIMETERNTSWGFFVVATYVCQNEKGLRNRNDI